MVYYRFYNLTLTSSSALLVLHKMTLDLCSNSNESAGCNQKEAAAMAIQTVTRIIIDIARKFLADLAFIDLLALPLPYTFCLYQAALLHIEFAGDEFLSPRWSSGMESLQGTLRHFANRWNIGSMYDDTVSKKELTNSIRPVSFAD